MALYLDLGRIDETTDRLAGSNALAEYHSIYPHRTTLYLRAMDLEYLRVQLRRIARGGKQIAALFISAHGSQHGGQAIVAFSESRFGRSTTHYATRIAELFPAEGIRFTADARILFDSCELLAQAPAQNLQRMADAFGLRTGLLYANQTLGFWGRETFESSPLEGASPVIWLIQLTAPISYPMWEFSDRILFNRGYLLTRSEEMECIGRAHFRDVAQRYFAQ